MQKFIWLICMTAVALVSTSAAAQTTVSLAPTMDNTLFSESNNSNGGGGNLFVGFTQNGDDRRSLLAFEDLTAIPPGSVITEVSLDISVTRGVGGPINVSLFEVTTGWGEAGSFGGSGGGQGGAAQEGDATWNFARVQSSGNQAWQTPGGDFVEPVLSSASIPNAGNASFPSSSEWVDVVQGWLDGSRDNFGLIMVSSTTTPRTAKRIGSRENGSAPDRPVLNVTYTEGGGGGDTPVVASGLWFDPGADGDGFNIIESPAPAGKGTTANQITIFFFGYDASGARLWLVSETLPGPFLLNQTKTFAFLAGGTSGNFQVPAPSSELIAWGTLAVTLDSCTSGSFVLDGADGAKTMNAVQLVPIDGVTCSAAQR